ncbi:hypothetical protein ACT7DF_04910 [Bacillus cereus]
MKSLLRKKALSTESPKQLARTLTALDLTFLGIGAVIGTGIFVLTGIVAAKHSGPGIDAIIPYCCIYLCLCSLFVTLNLLLLFLSQEVCILTHT